MRLKVLRSLVAAVALTLAACATPPRLAEPGPYPVGAAYSVTLGKTWSDITSAASGLSPNVRVLSIDGVLLNRLYLAHDIPAGQGLIKPERRQEAERVPVFRADMTSRELSEMLVETLVAMGYQRVEEVELTPARFLDSDGVRVLLSAQTQPGLNMSALAVAAARGGKLQALLFVAPSEYYFPRDEAEITRMFNNIGPAQ